MSRDDFSKPTIERLRQRVAWKCSNPSCQASTVASGSGDEKVVILGVAAHIHAAAPGGPRYVPEMLPVERKAITNGIWLCQNCSRLIDVDVENYPPELLRTWRAEAERRSYAALGKPLDGLVECTTSPTENEVGKVLVMAAQLLEIGRKVWRAPSLVARLSLEELVGEESKSKPFGMRELTASLDEGETLLLMGAGGLGKTTLALEAAGLCLDRGRRIPVFVDTPLWADSGVTLFRYLASLPAAEALEISVKELSRLAEAGRLVLFLNGWNEIEVSRKRACLNFLMQQILATEQLSFVITSRFSVASGNLLPSMKCIHVSGLTWDGQVSVVRAELESNQAESLIHRMARDSTLRYSARSPLILQGVIAQTKLGTAELSSDFDLLGACVQWIEDDGRSKVALSALPVEGHQLVYLEQIACEMTRRVATRCSRAVALAAVHAAAIQLQEKHLIGSVPSPQAVLEVLSNYHLLHVDSGVYRFAHQRFQEYYAATRLLRECLDERSGAHTLCEADNLPAWEPSLKLVAASLRGAHVLPAARVKLVSTAAHVDLGLACDFAGECGFSARDNADLYAELVRRVSEFFSSEFDSVKNLGVAYQKATRFQVFAKFLWPLIESEDAQVRLRTYRLDGRCISLCQLGEGARQRLKAWPLERRVEFVFESSNNPDNFDLLIDLAQQESEPTVRAAAICSLLWDFPAFEGSQLAWLNSPKNVQTDPQLLSHIVGFVEDGYADCAVRERLVDLANSGCLADGSKARLAIACPEEFGPIGLDAVFKTLEASGGSYDESMRLDLARALAPVRLLEVASDRAMDKAWVPDWVGNELQRADNEWKSEVFERAWDVIVKQRLTHLNPQTLGPLANEWQMKRGLEKWLKDSERQQTNYEKCSYEAHLLVERLLLNGRNEILMDIISKRVEGASAEQRVLLLKLVLGAIERDDQKTRSRNGWVPSRESFDCLVSVLSEKSPSSAEVHSEVLVFLASIASYVAPEEFDDLVHSAWTSALDVWVAYRAQMDDWAKRGRAHSPRPKSPQTSHILTAAAVRRGVHGLRGLFRLLTHPAAEEHVLDAICRVSSESWPGDREKLSFDRLDCIVEGELRRQKGCVFRRFDQSVQPLIDEAASLVGEILSNRVDTCFQQSIGGETFNAEDAAYRIGQLSQSVVKIPSEYIIEPICKAIRSGLLNSFGLINLLEGLLRYGYRIEDGLLVASLETQYGKIAASPWLDKSKCHTLAGLCRYFLLAVPPNVLGRSVDDCLAQWRRWMPPTNIAASLGSARSVAAWEVLVTAEEFFTDEDGASNEAYFLALIDTLSVSKLKDFCERIRNGWLFKWNGYPWMWVDKRRASSIASILIQQAGAVEDFVDACWQAAMSEADELAGYVLLHVDGAEKVREAYLRKALRIGRPAFPMLKELFTLRTPLGDSQFEVSPQANNDLRLDLYVVARDDSPIAKQCKDMLAELECDRREDGRPDDEIRHPNLRDGVPWTSVLTTIAPS
ncbi:hypothetical protein [Candidatus Accumulibacter sp. ACC005]|uniref:NACHT domain-containing protein n=1 Tax=Candidatus Accumulibacter sp. ACC005 TaxID=2823331 RepID=UPI0025BDCF7F|nr:hypothetical protein [Candidatus Accumulibacter sp. ACC005]